jgi:hypothetical protein
MTVRGGAPVSGDAEPERISGAARLRTVSDHNVSFFKCASSAVVLVATRLFDEAISLGEDWIRGRLFKGTIDLLQGKWGKNQEGRR